jgi:hypothetical protein
MPLCWAGRPGPEYSMKGEVVLDVLTMNETALMKQEQKPAPSKRKSAFPEKKAKRKMAQASRKRNR